MTVACYTRVSTAKQNLDRQLTSTQQYAEDTLGTSLDDIEVYRDKSSGTNTSRDAYQRLMTDAEAGKINAVVAHEVSRVARSISDLERTADRLREAGVELHIVSESLVMKPDEEDPYQRALFQMLGVFGELEARIKRQNIREGISARQGSDEYRHGPAPLGFEKDNGKLVERANYHYIVTVLERVAADEMSQRAAADELNVGRKTIRRSITERNELYGI